MSERSPNEITQLLREWSLGDELALENLMPLVYAELHLMARRYMQSQPSGHTLQPTALIHEMYVKLAGQEEQNWQNRAHFFGVASKAMRHILVDHARNRSSRKRSGGQRVDLNEEMIISDERSDGLVELDEALTRLSLIDERKGRVVEMKYFGGLSNEEMAQVLKVTTKTVIRDWQFARTWLLRELSN
ncbi:MAG TPA: sigma-70 family RNA polymerase sigma factor [Pyrinomonadaceae bacterium]|nr:sigma-70 family RNA polymerase sigma factor [Acidobacteriota bacterium]HQZ96661.1 sigma-70 family RNA polymerase sigma factor [Pyrinomonadaceae bacterium]